MELSRGLNSIIAAAVLVTAVPSPAWALGLGLSAVRGNDVTTEYRVSGNALDPHELQNTRILFVTGILADATLALHGEYFDSQVEWARRENVDFYRIPLRSEARMDDNARDIAQFIRSSEKRVTIVAHSKGALEVLDALVQEPSIRSKVDGFISIQGPFMGSPVAEFLSDLPFIMLPTNWFFRTILDGTGDSLIELGESFRLRWMSQHAAEIPQVLASVPTLSVGTWKDPDPLKPWKIDTLMKPTRDALLAMGLHNDGVVPWQSAILPGSDYVALPGVDHVSTVSRNIALHFDNVDFTNRLIRMALVRKSMGEASKLN